MARINAYSLALLLFCYVLSGAAEAAYNVAGFGAKHDGRTDSSGAFASAWSAACRSREPATVHVPNGHFLLSRAAFTGPCSSRVTLQVDGTLQRRGRRLDRVRPRRRPHRVGRHRRRPRRGAVGVQGCRARRVPQWSNSELPYHITCILFLQVHAEVQTCMTPQI